MPQEWIFGLIGGALIGCAAAMYLLINGRIMGASGIVGGLIDGTGRGTARERLMFLIGLIGVPGLAAYATGNATSHLTGNIGVLIVAGLLVGVGTRLANGCTSGHGVCGISRFSLRGIVATVFYLLAGGLTVVAARHIWGLV